MLAHSTSYLAEQPGNSRQVLSQVAAFLDVQPPNDGIETMNKSCDGSHHDQIGPRVHLDEPSQDAESQACRDTVQEW